MPEIIPGSIPDSIPRPGDIINTRPELGPIRFSLLHPKSIPGWAIQRHQRKRGFADPLDTHTMVYLGPERIFSVTWPRTRWEKWVDVRERLWACFRPEFPLDATDLLSLEEAAAQMIGTHYDIGQLLDIALNRILGYSWDRYRVFFDGGLGQRVCSVGARTLYEHARKRKEALGQAPPFDVLFSVDGIKLSVERTTPADFANTPGRFRKVGEWGRWPYPTG